MGDYGRIIQPQIRMIDPIRSRETTVHYQAVCLINGGMEGRERQVNPRSSDSRNILPINREVRRIYHHLCRQGGEEGAEKMVLAEIKTQPTFFSLSSEPSTSSSFIRKMKPHSSCSTKMLTYTMTNTQIHTRTHWKTTGFSTSKILENHLKTH